MIPRKNVVLNPCSERTITLLDPHFEGLPSEITSGVRTQKDQLDLICLKVMGCGFKNQFFEFNLFYDSAPDVTCKINGGGTLYWWQRAWSHLLNLASSGKVGAIINPPIQANCLEDYISEGINKKGMAIPISTHMMGLAFDIGGGADLAARVARLDTAIKSTECFIKSRRTEGSQQNCLHVTCFPI